MQLLTYRHRFCKTEEVFLVESLFKLQDYNQTVLLYNSITDIFYDFVKILTSPDNKMHHIKFVKPMNNKFII